MSAAVFLSSVAGAASGVADDFLGFSRLGFGLGLGFTSTSAVPSPTSTTFAAFFFFFFSSLSAFFVPRSPALAFGL